VTNLYNILEVSNTASQAQIRKSFRNLALKYHPDRNKNSEEAKQKFMQIVEAYQVLSDEQTRKQYDTNTYYGTHDWKSASDRWNRWMDAYRNFDKVYNYKNRWQRTKSDSRSQGGRNGNAKSTGSVQYISKRTRAKIRKTPMVLFDHLASAVRSVAVTTPQE
jgi:DnaJ-class molecular chaperone